MEKDIEKKVGDCLKFLEEKGWSELIDKKWKKDVIKDLKEEFPDIDKETIGEVLSVVLW